MEEKKILHYIILDSDVAFTTWQLANSVQLNSLAPIVNRSDIVEYKVTNTGENVFTYSIFVTYYDLEEI